MPACATSAKNTVKKAAAGRSMSPSAAAVARPTRQAAKVTLRKGGRVAAK